MRFFLFFVVVIQFFVKIFNFFNQYLNGLNGKYSKTHIWMNEDEKWDKFEEQIHKYRNVIT